MPIPTIAFSWPGQQTINRAIADVFGELQTLLTTAQTDQAAFRAAVASLQSDIDDLISYLGEDCAGGDCGGGGTPPYGDCGNCTTGTPGTYVLDFSGVDLTGEATANTASWNAFFNGTNYALDQTAQCDWRGVQNTAIGDYNGTDVLSVEFLIAIATEVTVTINGYDDSDAGGSLVFSTTLQIVESDDDPAAPDDCSDLPPTADHWNLTGDWATDGVGTFDLTISPPGGAGGTLTWPG